MRVNETIIEEEKFGPSQEGTTHGYRLEARFNYHEPRNFGGIVLDNRWREIPWWENKKGQGVPRPYFTPWALQGAHLMTKDECEAHRWLLICAANADTAGGAICLETRLVEYKVIYSYEATPVRYLDAMDYKGRLPKDMEPSE